MAATPGTGFTVDPSFEALTPAEQDAKLTAYFKSAKGKVPASWAVQAPGVKPYVGKSFLSLYDYLKTLPGATPLTAGEEVLSLDEGSVAIGAGQSATDAVGDANDAVKGAALGAIDIGAKFSSPLQFLDDLANPLLWIRVAKVGVGSVILLIGLAKLTGADQKIGGIAAKAVKAAPLL